MKKIRLLFLLVVFLSWDKTSAQVQILDELNLAMYNSRVKLVDEFFARFNGFEQREDVSKQYSNRVYNILMLNDLSKFKSKSDTLFLKALSFANKVTEDSLYINYADTCWYAKARCNGQIGKKKVDFNVYLFVEQRGEDMFKWVIADVEGEAFDNSRNIKHQDLFMYPNVHEQSFSALSRITNETSRYIDDYVIKNYKSDALSAFLALVRSGQLKIDYVSDVEFYFHQIPNYVFTVKHFERESMNVGWLINSVIYCSEKEKQKTIMSLRHVTENTDCCPAPLNDTIKVCKIEKEAEETKSQSDSTRIPRSCENVVTRFGSLLNLWCQTNNNFYFKKAIGECSGKKGAECIVDSTLMLSIGLNESYSNYSFFTIKDFCSTIKKQNSSSHFNFVLSNVRQEDETDLNFIINCDMLLVGDLNLNKKLKIIISKQDNKISHITFN